MYQTSSGITCTATKSNASPTYGPPLPRTEHEYPFLDFFFRQSDAEHKPKASDFWARNLQARKMYSSADKIVDLNLNCESAEPVQDALTNFVGPPIEQK